MTYLTQSVIANDAALHNRITCAAAQEGCADAGIHPVTWTSEWRFTWAAAPGWDAAWESAIAGGILEPGASSAVITDAMILSQVQSMMPFDLISDHAPA